MDAPLVHGHDPHRPDAPRERPRAHGFAAQPQELAALGRNRHGRPGPPPTAARGRRPRLAASFRTSVMWQIGHSPGLSETTWGCMGQRHAAPDTAGRRGLCGAAAQQEAAAGDREEGQEKDQTVRTAVLMARSSPLHPDPRLGLSRLKASSSAFTTWCADRRRQLLRPVPIERGERVQHGRERRPSRLVAGERRFVGQAILGDEPPRDEDRRLLGGARAGEALARGAPRARAAPPPGAARSRAGAPPPRRCRLRPCSARGAGAAPRPTCHIPSRPPRYWYPPCTVKSGRPSLRASSIPRRSRSRASWAAFTSGLPTSPARGAPPRRRPRRGGPRGGRASRTARRAARPRRRFSSARRPASSAACSARRRRLRVTSTCARSTSCCPPCPTA